jgi:proteasome lid subunit RPN8/RPN11
MGLRITEQLIGLIRHHGERDYPNECCGMLLGHGDGERKQVQEVVALKNLRTDREVSEKYLPLKQPGRESERNRYLIDPQDQIKVEKDARARGLEVVGYYHSHPDHPAQPSDYDREHAWPWYSYIIVSIERGEPKDVTCWVLSEDRSRFEPERMEVLKL